MIDILENLVWRADIKFLFELCHYYDYFKVSLVVGGYAKKCGFELSVRQGFFIVKKSILNRLKLCDEENVEDNDGTNITTGGGKISFSEFIFKVQFSTRD